MTPPSTSAKRTATGPSAIAVQRCASRPRRRCRDELGSAAVRCAVIGVAMASALVFSGCASDTPTRYFALEAVAPAAAASASGASAASGASGGSAMSAGVERAGAGGPLEVQSVQIPPTLDRAELVRQLPRGEIAVRDFAHWAAPLGRMTRQVLTEDLAMRLPASQVVFPGAAGPDPRSSLTVDILSFTVADGIATMRVSWALRRPPASSSAATATATATATADAPPRAAPGSQIASLRLEAVAGDGDAATARAWSALIGQLADNITAALAAP